MEISKFLKKSGDKEKLLSTKKGRRIVMENHIHNLCERARIMSGLRQKDLAEKLGTSQSYISRIEGQTMLPSMKRFIEIMEATGFYFEMDIKKY